LKEEGLKLKYYKTQQIVDKSKLEQVHILNVDFVYRSNNWLKSHKKPMRRRPFKKRQIAGHDEMHIIFNRKYNVDITIINKI